MALAVLSIAASAEAAQIALPEVPHYELSFPTNHLKQPRYDRNLGHNQTDNRGTATVTFVIKELSRERSQEEKIETQEKAALDRKLTEYTGDLAFYTKYLFLATLLLASLTGSLAFAAFFQMRDARKAIGAAETAAKAAERHATVAEQTFVHVERPYLFYERIRMAEPITREWLDPNMEIRRKTIGVFYDIKNYGRTPAVIIERGNSVYIGRIFQNVRFIMSMTSGPMNTFSALALQMTRAGSARFTEAMLICS